MKGIENIYDGKKLVSIIFRKNIESLDSVFITPKKYPIQVGIHNTPAEKISHIHKNGSLNITGEIDRHEVLLVQSGAIKIDYFTKAGKTIVSKKLKKGDGVLIMDTIHQVTMSKNSKVIEIKQGPYAEKS